MLLCIRERYAPEEMSLDSSIFPSPPRNPFRRFCLWILSLFGWRTVLAPFPEAKGVVVVYPHTSNWDFVVGMLYRLGHAVPVHWLGKHSLFRWPFAGLLQRLGGIAIDRRTPGGAIRSIVDEFDRREFMWLALAPEGTRSYTDHLKSGFYQIALAAGVPCGLGHIDYVNKTVGIGTFVSFSGDMDEDMDKLRAFYADKQGLRPEQASELRLRLLPSPEADAAPPRQDMRERDPG